ncbi:MAG TPA: polysaccharide biosynthesis protein, partial [Clostridiales bacterium]|nr:polysaccharide biosynthesis protein [Clostridiales bacterium]
VLSLAGIVAKVIGAAYRVPLAALLKSEGLGIYQLVFPLYCVLLTFSSTGVPSGISKLVADGAEGECLKRKAFLLFGFFGLVGSLTMFSFAGRIARAQGEENAAWAYRALSPSVALVSIISVVRGIFQGEQNMVPTAVSQVVEQVVKAAASLAFGFLFGKTVAEKAAFATLGVTLSEAV